MSGHSKWAGIKHKKAIVDAKRGKIFTRIGREITVAAKEGGGNPEHNARLRKAMDDAREANMPQENIKRAVQKGTGEIPGVIIEEVRYEGYGPGGAAVLVEATTDNRNRTSSEIRKIFADHNGAIAEAGSVSWMFSLKGVIAVEKKTADEDHLMSVALDAGAQDLKTTDEDYFEIYTDPADFEKVKGALKFKSIPIANQELTQVSQTIIPLTGSKAEDLLRLIGELEDHEDVKTVFSNYDIPKEIFLKVNA